MFLRVLIYRGRQYQIFNYAWGLQCWASRQVKKLYIFISWKGERIKQNFIIGQESGYLTKICMRLRINLILALKLNKKLEFRLWFNRYGRTDTDMVIPMYRYTANWYWYSLPEFILEQEILSWIGPKGWKILTVIETSINTFVSDYYSSRGSPLKLYQSCQSFI